MRVTRRPVAFAAILSGLTLGAVAAASAGAGRGPDADGAAMRGLCTAWSNKALEESARPLPPPFRNLVDVAAAAGLSVEQFCAGVTPPTTTSTTTPGSTTTTLSPTSTTTFPGSSTTFPGSSTTTFPGSSTTTFPGSSTTTFPGSSTTFPGSSTTTFPGSSTTFPAADHAPGRPLSRVRRPRSRGPRRPALRVRRPSASAPRRRPSANSVKAWPLRTGQYSRRRARPDLDEAHPYEVTADATSVPRIAANVLRHRLGNCQ